MLCGAPHNIEIETIGQTRGRVAEAIRSVVGGTTRHVGTPTRPRFNLVSLGAFPALVSGGEVAVRGEVYDIDAPTLGALDRLEGYPGFYTREPVELDGEVTGEALAYLLNPERVAGSPEISHGDWKAWRKENRR